MDKKTIIGLVIIVAVLIGFNVFNQPSEEEVKKWDEDQKELAEEKRAEFVKDSLERITSSVDNSIIPLTDSAGIIQRDSAGNIIPDTFAMNNATIKALTDLESSGEPMDTSHSAYKLTVATNPYLHPERDSLKFKTIYDSLLLGDREKEYQRKIAEGINSQYGIFAVAAEEAEEEYFYLENEKLNLKISSKGGQIAQANVKGFLSYQDYMDSIPDDENNKSIQLFDQDSTTQNLRISPSSTKDFLNTKDLNFKLAESTSKSIKLRALTSNAGKYIEFHYYLDEGYVLNYDVNLIGIDQDLANNNV
ncbi:MAG: hypothetical protein ACI9J3_001943, partial [Parvicellaceae bacterium]